MSYADMVSQQRWSQALITERLEKARKTFHRLNCADFRTLTPHDRALLDAFGWLTLEYDDEPEVDLEERGTPAAAESSASGNDQSKPVSQTSGGVANAGGQGE